MLWWHQYLQHEIHMRYKRVYDSPTIERMYQFCILTTAYTNAFKGCISVPQQWYETVIM